MGRAKKGVVDEYAEQLMLNAGRSWGVGASLDVESPERISNDVGL
jgi:hypothetical protein